MDFSNIFQKFKFEKNKIKCTAFYFLFYFLKSFQKIQSFKIKYDTKSFGLDDWNLSSNMLSKLSIQLSGLIPLLYNKISKFKKISGCLEVVTWGFNRIIF